MKGDDVPILSAQVVLHGRRRSPAGADRITAENVQEYVPAEASAALARSMLAAAGFEVGPLVANSFYITGPSDLFERVFGVRLERGRGGEVKVWPQGSGRPPSHELPVPPDLSGHVAAVTFTPPPEFGPTNFGP